MCMTGANARQLERKMMCLLKILIIFAKTGRRVWFSAKWKCLDELRKNFAKIYDIFLFSPIYTIFRIFAKMEKSIYVSILCALNFYAK